MGEMTRSRIGQVLAGENAVNWIRRLGRMVLGVGGLRTASELVETPPGRPPADSKPSESALISALHENWLHARHAQELRDRLNNLYWVSWGAILALVKDDAVNRPSLFAFFVILSAVVISTSLKWTAEFANHIAAAYSVSERLGLVVPNRPGRRAISARRPLPFPEHVGYMGFPLEAPIFLNVGATLTVAQCIGISVAIWLVAYSFVGPTIASVLGVLSFGFSVVVCFSILRLTAAAIEARQPPT